MIFELTQLHLVDKIFNHMGLMVSASLKDKETLVVKMI